MSYFSCIKRICFSAGLFILALTAIPTQTAIADNAATVKLGATLPLTGNLASYGERIQQGALLAINDLKASGVDVSFSPEDTPMSGPGVLSVFRSLVDSKQIKGIAGNFSNVAMLNMASALAKDHIIAMHTAAMDDDILAASHGWIFSTNTRVRDEASKLAQHAYELGARKAAVITIQTNFGEGYRKHFKAAFEKLGGKVVADETYQLGDLDYRTQITRLKATEPDIVFAATFGHFLGLTLKQARAARMETKFLSVYESEDTSVIEAAGKSADGLQYFVSYNPQPDTQAEELRRRYRDQFHMEAGSFALNAYDATTLLTRALATCTLDSECAKQSLHKVKDYAGASGTITIGEDGAADRAFYLREIRDGKFISPEVK